MKKYNFIILNQAIIKERILFIFIVVLVIFCSCKKHDDNFILKNEWKLKSIIVENKTIKPSSNNHREDAYVLKFFNDTVFSLNTSVNYACGNFNIISDNDIYIYNYHSITMVGSEGYFDTLLEIMLNDVKHYSCVNNKLTFEINKNNKIVFEKK